MQSGACLQTSQKILDTLNTTTVEKDAREVSESNEHCMKEKHLQGTDSDEKWSEDEENEVKIDGVYDTMLDNQQKILSFAPSEGNVPVSSNTDVFRSCHVLPYSVVKNGLTILTE